MPVSQVMPLSGDTSSLTLLSEQFGPVQGGAFEQPTLVLNRNRKTRHENTFVHLRRFGLGGVFLY